MHKGAQDPAHKKTSLQAPNYTYQTVANSNHSTSDKSRTAKSKFPKKNLLLLLLLLLLQLFYSFCSLSRADSPSSYYSGILAPADGFLAPRDAQTGGSTEWQTDEEWKICIGLQRPRRLMLLPTRCAAHDDVACTSNRIDFTAATGSRHSSTQVSSRPGLPEPRSRTGSTGKGSIKLKSRLWVQVWVAGSAYWIRVGVDDFSSVETTGRLEVGTRRFRSFPWRNVRYLSTFGQTDCVGEDPKEKLMLKPLRLGESHMFEAPRRLCSPLIICCILFTRRYYTVFPHVKPHQTPPPAYNMIHLTCLHRMWLHVLYSWIIR